VGRTTAGGMDVEVATGGMDVGMDMGMEEGMEEGTVGEGAMGTNDTKHTTSR
jgi:hypothetical protein